MAIFQYDDVLRLHPLDYMLLQNGPITLYYRREVLENDISWLLDHDYQIDAFYCKDWWWIDDVFEAIYPKLSLPKPGIGWGGSIDDLNDELYDLVIPENSGRVLVFYQYDQLASHAPEISEVLLDVIACQARYHLLFGRRMIVLVQSNNPKLTFNKVGGCPVMWNFCESTKQSRGI
jgi:hypothetical protein